MTTDGQSKERSMELAEDSREKEWVHPSFMGELFRGRFDWKTIHPFPEQSAEDKRAGDEVIEQVNQALRGLDPQEVDRTGEVPKEVIDELARIGVFGLKIPKEYGGLGLSQVNYNRVLAVIGSYCQSTAVWVSAHQSIGVPQPLLLFGTEEQKKTYLPRFCKGAVSAFALTEPGVGSDPARMTTSATLDEDGKHYILNGEKLWCTNGPIAEVLIVMALTEPKIVNGKERPQITAFIVESDTPGFEVAHVCEFMGIRGIKNGLLRFNNVKVPKENIIGKTGDGLRIALTTLNTGRLTIPGTSAASGKVTMDWARQWAQERVQWGLPVGRHQAMAAKLSAMAADTFAMESMNRLACAMVDRGGVDIRLEAAVAKYFCTETAWRIADDFLQVRGGRGYETAKSLADRGEAPVPAEQMMRDCRIARIIEGTSEIMQLFIAREALDTHMSLVMPLLTGKAESKGGQIWKIFKFYASWYPKQWLPAGGDLSAQHLSAENRGHLAYIGRAAKRLARNIFHTMAKHKKKLETEQLTLACYVDIGADLFAMAASLARAESMMAQHGADPALQDLVDLFCRNARKRIERNFRDARKNHNHLKDRVAGHLLDGAYGWTKEDVHPDLAALAERTGIPEGTVASTTVADVEGAQTEEPEHVSSASE